MRENVLEKLKDLFSNSGLYKYRKGEIIMRSDEQPQGVFYVKSGHIQFYTIFEDGRELILNIFKPGSYFPMMWAIGNIPNTYYYRAMMPAELHRVSKEKVLDFLHKNPDVLFELTRRILIGLDGLLTNVQHLFSGNAYHRVLSALLLLAKRFGEESNRGIVIKLPVTHQDIANLASITRETASVELKKIERKKIIFYNRQLLRINNRKMLEKEVFIYGGLKSHPFTI